MCFSISMDMVTLGLLSEFTTATVTAHSYLFWRVQAAVSPMTRSSDNTDAK